MYTYFFHAHDKERVRLWFQWMASQMTAAGCTMQKFGQWISMRPDVFAPELIDAVSHLREHAPAHSYEQSRASFKESFGKEIEEVFDSFDSKPIASGTIAQVHHGVLKPEYAFDNGTREVAVKIRHPNVLAETWFDGWLVMKIMPIIAWFGPSLGMPFKMDTFHQILHKQVDFNWEAYHLSVFAHNFATEIADAKKLQAARIARIAAKAADGAAKSGIPVLVRCRQQSALYEANIFYYSIASQGQNKILGEFLKLCVIFHTSMW